jgi:hypothetical protein
LTGQKNKPHNKRLFKRDSIELGTKPNPPRSNSISQPHTGRIIKQVAKKCNTHFQKNNFFYHKGEKVAQRIFVIVHGKLIVLFTGTILGVWAESPKSVA